MSLNLVSNFKSLFGRFVISFVGYFAFLGIVTLFPFSASHATSCCVGGGGQSLCVLPFEQSYQFAISNSFRNVTGQFDPYGDYRENETGTGQSVLTTSFGSALRLSDNWQAGITLPLVHNRNSINHQKNSATKLGDPVVEARYSLWEDLAFLKYRPAISLYGGLRLPVGKSVYDSSDPLGADITGDGYYTSHVGFTLTKMYRPLNFSVDGAFFTPFSKKVEKLKGSAIENPYTVKSGTAYQVMESVSWLLDPAWSTTLGFRQYWKGKSSLDSKEVDGSAARAFWTSFGLSYFHDDNWSSGLNYETGSPFFRYFANQSNSYSFSMAITYGG